MTPVKGEYPAHLVNKDGSVEGPDAAAEKKTDQALGYLVMSALRETFKGPQGVLITVLLAWLGFSPAAAFWHPTPMTMPADMLPIIKRIESDVLEIKITNKAVLNTLPEQARKEALRQIQLQLAAVAMARNKDAQ